MYRTLYKGLEELDARIDIMKSDILKLGLETDVDDLFYVRLASAELNKYSTKFDMRGFEELVKL